MRQIRTLKKLDATVRVPDSKSYTQRALIIASLAEGESLLRGALISEDTNLLIEALRSLGAGILVAGTDIAVTGTGGVIQNPGKKLFLGNNGTALRFLTTLASLSAGEITLDGSDRLRQRPLQPLLGALQGLGVVCRSTEGNGCPPVVIQGGGLQGGRAVFTDARSSQYISSLLIGAPYARENVTVEMRGTTASLPYIDMTGEVMRHFGVDLIQGKAGEYIVRAPQKYAGKEYLIEGDVSSASYFFLAATLCRGRVRVLNINPDTPQGDIGLLKIIEQLGGHVLKGRDWVEVTGNTLHAGGYRFDMGNMPDMVPTLAVLSAFRPGRTVITNVSHLRLKESDRIAALVNELNRTGIDAEEREDGLVINGGRPHGARIETYDDHRIAMSFAVAGFAVEGMEIKNEACVGKSFPGFWEEMERLYP
ncbi:MAG: 3-phosphoshikimate 1-carboxyvinyltransferase [Deltaproteobacteria bacterium]|nr:3-phosphoshikimate 1-carboxyvinyltransferase [Deltaproteobacteria bacterium]